MQYGAVSGIKKPVSRLVQGTIMISSSERARSFQLLDEIFEQGCNTFDTVTVSVWLVNGFGNEGCVTAL
jgi:aryl-alcohol dehydrogenase-like predicted oxidoreductase